MIAKPISIAIGYDGGPPYQRPRVAHIFVVYNDGSIWERMTDQPPGQWTKWTDDQMPQQVRKRTPRK